MAQSNWSCSSTAREAFEPGARWVRARDEAGRVLVLPSQVPGLVEEYGLSRAQTDSALWAIDATGHSVCGRGSRESRAAVSGDGLVLARTGVPNRTGSLGRT